MKQATVKDVPINKTFAMQINKKSRSPKQKYLKKKLQTKR
jgi:hypothetical protein